MPPFDAASPLADLDDVVPIDPRPEPARRGRPPLERPARDVHLTLFEDQYEELVAKFGRRHISKWVREVFDRELGLGADGQPT